MEQTNKSCVLVLCPETFMQRRQSGIRFEHRYKETIIILKISFTFKFLTLFCFLEEKNSVPTYVFTQCVFVRERIYEYMFMYVRERERRICVCERESEQNLSVLEGKGNQNTNKSIKITEISDSVK